jgi:LCP family protein required for cell wall assembly
VSRGRTQSAPPPAVDHQGWGPEVTGRGGGRGVLRRLLLLLLAVVLVAMLVVPFLASARLTRMPVEGLASGGSPTHILVMGSDSREGLTPEEERELSTGSGDVFTGERIDTILLLTVDRGQAAMLSFPRDLWVERCDGSVGRLNAASAIDGPGCLVDTIHRASGIRAHHAVRVTFGGFRDVVDAVGGVELCLEDPIADRDAGIDLPAGCQVLDGADALGYVRVRKIDDDFQRMQRQQRFVSALAREVTQPAVLFNPAAMWRLSGDAGAAVQVDRSMGVLDLAQLAWAGRSIAAGTVASYTVPVDPRTTAGGAYVLDLQQPEAETLFARFRDGSVLLESVEDGEPEQPAVTRSDVLVTVANGAGVDGLAGRMADELAALGYQIGEVTNAPPTVTTLVRYPPGEAAAARLVAGDVPGPTALEEAPDVDHVTVVLSPEAAA